MTKPDWKEKLAAGADRVRVRAGYAGKMTRLALETNLELEAVQRSYAEIGRLYYEHHRNDSDPLLAQLCDEVTQANERIEANERRMDELRAALRTPDIAVELEELPPDEDAPKA